MNRPHKSDPLYTNRRERFNMIPEPSVSENSDIHSPMKKTIFSSAWIDQFEYCIPMKIDDIQFPCGYGVRSRILLTPDEKYERLINSFDEKNYNHMNFKKLCDSLKINNPIHMEIKNMIINYCSLLPIPKNEDIYKMLLVDIYNANLTDFVINLPNNKSISCMKIILLTIPYFDIIIEDTGIQSEFDLEINYDIMNCIIKLLYIPETEIITVHNFIDLFIQMDKYLMREHFHVALKFAKHNITDIVKYLLNETKFDDIRTLYIILCDIKNQHYDKTNLSIEDIKEVTNYVTEIITTMLTVYFGKHITLFDKWTCLFTDEQKINNISRSNNLELLNVAHIIPTKVLELLSDIDFSSNIYNTVHHFAKITNAEIILEKNGKFTVNKSKLLIKSYYPLFQCLMINKINAHVINAYKNIMVITINYLYSPITIGTRLLLGDIITDMTLNNIYTVINIVKRSNNNKIKVSSVENNSLTQLSTISFELFFDKIVLNNKRGPIMWSIECIDHNIAHSIENTVNLQYCGFKK